MKEILNEWRKFVNLVEEDKSFLSEAASPADIEQAKKDYGQYLFGDIRGKGEPDTEKEKEISKTISNFYAGQLYDFSEEFRDKLKHLRSLGIYNDVLEPPSGLAYRWVTLPASMTQGFKGQEIKVDFLPAEYLKETFDALQMKVYAISAGRQYIGKSSGTTTMRGVADSWTMNPEAIEMMWADMNESFSINSELIVHKPNQSGVAHNKNSVMFAVANVDQNRNSFIFNHNEMAPYAKKFDVSYQDEVMQIAPVKLSGGIIIDILVNPSDQKLPYETVDALRNIRQKHYSTYQNAPDYNKIASEVCMEIYKHFYMK